MMQFFLRPLSWIAKPAAIVAAICMFAIPLASPAQVYVGISIGSAPPALPYYAQPVLMTPGEIWQPGYWAWGPAGYYWVPGTWVQPPDVGLYWTPGYWSYADGGYYWNNGYWANNVGFYGGINYGYGYNGTGYVGGAWNNGIFRYNTYVTNVNRTIIRNVYIDRTVVVRDTTVTRVSYNGPGGVERRPTQAEQEVARERHVQPTDVQVQHARIAAKDRNSYATVNHEHPQTTAVDKPIERTSTLPHYKPVTPADRAAAQPSERNVKASTPDTKATKQPKPKAHA